MNPLDEELKKTFRRLAPPHGFEERVLAKISAQPVSRQGLWEKMAAAVRISHLRWAAVGLMAVLFISLGVAEYLRQKRIEEEGKAAKTQVMLALQIASSKLNYAQRAVLARTNYLPEAETGKPHP
jgi:uncharacterized protein YdaU (DUF1376 family)